MKRIIIAFLTVALIVLAFAGCAQRDRDPNPTVTRVPTVRPTPTTYPDDDMNMSPTIAPNGLMPTERPGVSPQRTPGASPVASPSPNMTPGQ